MYEDSTHIYDRDHQIIITIRISKSNYFVIISSNSLYHYCLFVGDTMIEINWSSTDRSMNLYVFNFIEYRITIYLLITESNNNLDSVGYAAGSRK